MSEDGVTKPLPVLTRRVLVVAGCVVNQLLRADGCQVSDATVDPVLDFSRRERLALHVLPCPEMKLCGIDRPPRGRKWYAKNGLRDLCAQLARKQSGELEAYRLRGASVVGVVGIERSPACSTRQENPSAYYPSGIFMEELRATLPASVRFVSVTGSTTPAQQKKLDDLLVPEVP